MERPQETQSGVYVETRERVRTSWRMGIQICAILRDSEGTYTDRNILIDERGLPKILDRLHQFLNFGGSGGAFSLHFPPE